jgi:hypothetical protein
MTATFGDIAANVSGVRLVRHAVLTFAGTFAAPGTGYPSDVVNAANPDLVFEVPVQSPWSFGPIPPSPPLAPSYAESVQIAVNNATDWINTHPHQTFALGGYSQGAEAASRVLASIMTGPLQSARPNLIGGYTFGNRGGSRVTHFPGYRPRGRRHRQHQPHRAQIPKDANGADTWWISPIAAICTPQRPTMSPVPTSPLSTRRRSNSASAPT